VKRLAFQFSGAGEDFGPRADGLITAHTTESAPTALTLADAIALGRWQDRDDILGSYNDLICIDGILQCVPPSHASGGINPASVDFHPEPWLFEVMSPEMVRNPNYFTRNVSFMGSKAYFDKNGWPPEMIDNFVTVMLEEEQRIGRLVTLTDHEDFQTNRSDAGPVANALIRKRYAAVTLEDTMNDWITQARAILAPGPFNITIGEKSAIRFAPEITPESLDKLTATPWTITVIASVRGEEYQGSKLWYVFARDDGLRVTHSRNATSERMPLAETVIKEVPSGISQADLQQAIATARAAGIKAAAEAVASLE
jgi:hypothetical protein